jgi:hypothetical protein
MPKVIYAIDMMWQFGLSPNGLIVDLNCGWYCLNAALHYKNPSQPSSLPPIDTTFPFHNPHMAFDQPPIPTPDPRIIVPHPGLSIGYDPRTSGRTHDLDPIPTTGTEWYNALKKRGPILASIRILWGPAAHYILINGIDTDYPSEHLTEHFIIPTHSQASFSAISQSPNFGIKS